MCLTELEGPLILGWLSVPSTPERAVTAGRWTAHDRQFIGFTGLNPMPDDVPGAGGMEVGWPHWTNRSL